MNENHKNHKLLWNELARTGGDDKFNAIVSLSLPQAECSCYACEEARKYGGCQYCPITWVEGKIGVCIINTHSPFCRWDRAKTPRTRKKYAKIIANMKWRTKK